MILAVVLKLISLVPLELRRAILGTAVQSKFQKAPQTMIFPPVSSAKVYTTPLNPFQILNPVSCVPLIFIRVILGNNHQLYVLNCPAAMTLPSLCTARALTLLSNQFQILKLVFLLPSVFRLVIYFPAH